MPWKVLTYPEIITMTGLLKQASQPLFAQISQAIEMKIVPGHGFSEDRQSQLKKT